MSDKLWLITLGVGSILSAIGVLTITFWIMLLIDDREVKEEQERDWKNDDTNRTTKST